MTIYQRRRIAVLLALAAAGFAATAPNYNGQWLVGVMVFIGAGTWITFFWDP